MDAAKLDKLNHIKSALEDVHNSQIALVQKLAQMEISMMENPEKDLEAGISDMHSNASQNADIARGLLDKFNVTVDKANKEFTPAPEEDSEEASS